MSKEIPSESHEAPKKTSKWRNLILGGLTAATLVGKEVIHQQNLSEKDAQISALEAALDEDHAACVTAIQETAHRIGANLALRYTQDLSDMESRRREQAMDLEICIQREASARSLSGLWEEEANYWQDQLERILSSIPAPTCEALAEDPGLIPSDMAEFSELEKKLANASKSKP